MSRPSLVFCTRTFLFGPLACQWASMKRLCWLRLWKTSLCHYPHWAGRDKNQKTKSLGPVGEKKTSWSHNGKPTRCEPTDVCQERGSNTEAKLAHVIGVMREHFEDDCLSSLPSWADNLEPKKSAARLQSTPLSCKTINVGAKALTTNCRTIIFLWLMFYQRSPQPYITQLQECVWTI